MDTRIAISERLSHSFPCTQREGGRWPPVALDYYHAERDPQLPRGARWCVMDGHYWRPLREFNDTVSCQTLAILTKFQPERD